MIGDGWAFERQIESLQRYWSAGSASRERRNDLCGVLEMILSRVSSCAASSWVASMLILAQAPDRATRFALLAMNHRPGASEH
jgi:hypothetical protein